MAAWVHVQPVREWCRSDRTDWENSTFLQQAQSHIYGLKLEFLSLWRTNAAQTFCFWFYWFPAEQQLMTASCPQPPQLYLDHFKAHIKLIYGGLWLWIWHQRLFITGVFSAADRKSRRRKRKYRKLSVNELQRFREIRFWKQAALQKVWRKSPKLTKIKNPMTGNGSERNNETIVFLSRHDWDISQSSNSLTTLSTFSSFS